MRTWHAVQLVSVRHFLRRPSSYVLGFAPIPRIQNVLLLGAGYYFYACWSLKFLSLLVLSTVMDYACGLWVDRVQDTHRRRSIVALSMALNLGMLGFFKYYNFFAENLQVLLAQLGLAVPLDAVASDSSDRHLVLHISIDELRDRRLSA